MNFPKNKKYKIIYADPAWRYADPKGNNPKLGGITYTTMTDEEIAALPVSEIAEEDSFLFLWATMPKLEEALIVGRAWGFRYITCAFTWVKLNPNGQGIYSGIGHYTNGNAELCLLFRRGKGKVERKNKNVKQVQLFPRGKHSSKPPQIRNEIVRLFGDVSRIELFARNKVEGWDAWGNEIKDSEQELFDIEKT